MVEFGLGFLPLIEFNFFPLHLSKPNEHAFFGATYHVQSFTAYQFFEENVVPTGYKVWENHKGHGDHKQKSID